MKKTGLLILILSLCLPLLCNAQKVVTLAQSPYIQDGLFVDSKGNVFTTCGGLVNKTTIGLYSPETKEFKVLSKEMKGSIDITSLDDRFLFVTNYDDNTVKRYDRKTGKTENWASGLDGPAGIEIDQQGNLYVSSFGAPPNYSGNTIWKIDPQGNKEKLIEGNELFRPQGLGWFDEETLVVSNSSNGKLFLLNVKTKALNLLLNTGQPHGNIAMGRGKIYLASNRGHKIFEIDRSGKITATFGNSTPESKDGPLAEANFANPLGLAFSPDEKTLYVAQIQNGTLRAILFDQ